MMNRRGLVLVLGLCGLAVPVASAGQETLRVEEVVGWALSTHPALEAARWRVEAAGAAAGETRAAWWPTVTAVAVADRYQEPMVVAPLHGLDLSRPPEFDRTLVQGHASVDWTVFDGGYRRSRVGVAERHVDEAAAGEAAAADGVVLEAVASYLAVVTARSLVAAHEAQVAALESERGRATQLHEEGRAPWVQVLRTEAALSRAAAELESAREALGLAVHRLARVSGLEPERVASARLVGIAPAAGPPLDLAALQAAARSTHPAVAGAASRAAAAALGVAGTRSLWLPRISVGVRYSAFGSAEGEFQPEWQVGTRVSYPLFNGGARLRAADRAAAEAGAARAELAATTREVEDVVDAALVAYRSAWARALALDAAVAQAAEVARIEALALEAGAGVQTDYLGAEADVLSARAALAAARHTAAEAWVRLARATGRLGPDRLADLFVEVEP